MSSFWKTNRKTGTRFPTIPRFYVSDVPLGGPQLLRAAYREVARRHYIRGIIESVDETEVKEWVHDAEFDSRLTDSDRAVLQRFAAEQIVLIEGTKMEIAKAKMR